MKTLLSAAKQRHGEAIENARNAYFHGPGIVDDDDSNNNDDDDYNKGKKFLSNLILDEYEVKANGKIPDFDGELERRLFVTTAKTPLFSAQE